MKPAFLLIAALLALYSCGSSAILTLNAEGTFKIMQWTDIHMFIDVTDLLSEVVLRKTLETEPNVDLVVITGDTTSFIPSWDVLAPYTRRELSKPYNVLSRANQPFAFVFGNHDDEGPLSREQVMAVDNSYPTSLTQRGPASLPGITNYYLPVYPYGTTSEVGAKPVGILWFLADSDLGCETDKVGNGCLSFAQVNWFRNQSASLKAEYGVSDLFSLVFKHIPVPEYLDAWNQETCEGIKAEDVCCPVINTEFYAAAAQEGVRGMFVGHDHKNDFCGALSAHPQLKLCYGRKTGFGAYNPKLGVHHGARVIQIASDPSSPDGLGWETWIRNIYGDKELQEFHAPQGADQTACPAKYV